MALAVFQNETVSLDGNEVCFDEEQDIPNALEKSRNIIELLNGVDVGNVESWSQISSV